jgi:hypothetical protein
MVRTALIWLKIATSGGSCEHGNEPLNKYGGKQSSNLILDKDQWWAAQNMVLETGDRD